VSQPDVGHDVVDRSGDDDARNPARPFGRVAPHDEKAGGRDPVADDRPRLVDQEPQRVAVRPVIERAEEERHAAVPQAVAVEQPAVRSGGLEAGQVHAVGQEHAAAAVVALEQRLVLHGYGEDRPRPRAQQRLRPAHHPRAQGAAEAAEAIGLDVLRVVDDGDTSARGRAHQHQRLVRVARDHEVRSLGQLPAVGAAEVAVREVAETPVGRVRSEPHGRRRLACRRRAAAEQRHLVPHLRQRAGDAQRARRGTRVGRPDAVGAGGEDPH
jgi:hypothetical protein